MYLYDCIIKYVLYYKNNYIKLQSIKSFVCNQPLPTLHMTKESHLLYRMHTLDLQLSVYI